MHGNDLKLLIPAALNVTYLNTGTLGPTPSTALAAATASELEWVESGPGQDSHYLNARHLVGRFAMRIEQAMPGGVVSITENNSQGILRILWGISFQAGDEIVTSSHEHDSVVMALSTLIRRFGVRVRVADVSAGLVDQIARLMNDRTRLVVVSHVSYQTGWELPIADIAEVVRKFPACRLLVDGAQALGNIVVNPERIGADFYVFCGHKWMLAPAGWAGIWVRRERRDELFTRWPQKPDPVDPHLLEHGPLAESMANGADLEFGTRSWPRIAGWSVTWDYFEEEGFEMHQAYQRQLADRARATLDSLRGFSVLHPPTGLQPTALMTVACGTLGSGVYEHLLKRQVVAKPAPMGQGVRLAWAAFNTVDDLDCLVDALRDL